MKTSLLFSLFTLLFSEVAFSQLDCGSLFIIDTTAYYNANADFYSQTRGHVSVGLALQRQRFLSLLPKKSKILEIGAGPGRDALYFQEQGVDVTATEPSVSLARIAATTTGRPVAVVKAQDITYMKQFDGIWATASLIHVPPEQLHEVFLKLKRALKVGGVLHASFLTGVGIDDVPETIPDGRYFNRASAATLRRIVSSIGGLEVHEEFTGYQINDYFGKLAPTKEFGFYNLYVTRIR